MGHLGRRHTAWITAVVAGIAALVFVPSAGTDAASGPQVMLVAASTRLNADDTAIRTHLARSGYNVTIVDDDALPRVDVSRAAAVFVSSSVNPTKVGTRLNTAPVPVVLAHGQLLDDMLMTTAPTSSSKTASITIVEPGDPLAAGLTGGVVITSRTTIHTTATVLPSALVIAEASSRPALFAYPRGAELADGSAAPAARFFFPAALGVMSRATPALLDLLDATLAGRSLTLPAVTADDDAYVTDENTILRIGVGLSPMLLLGSDSPWSGSTSGIFSTMHHPMGVVFDEEDRFITVDPVNSIPLVRCDLTETVCDRLGDSPALSTMQGPADIAIDPAGGLVIADAHGDRLFRCDAEVTTCSEFGGPGTGPAQFDHPSGVAVANDGTIVVADSHNHRVQVCATTESSCRVFGQRGSQLGQFDRPIDVVALDAGDILVMDSWNQRVQRCEPATGSCVDFSPGSFEEPRHATIAQDGSVLIADSGIRGFLRCDQAGTVCVDDSQFPALPDTRLGALDGADGVAEDSRGNIVVTGADYTRVHVLSPGGVLHNDHHDGPGPLTVTGVDRLGAGQVGVPVETALGAVVVMHADGSFTYDPTPSTLFPVLPHGVAVTDRFPYTVTNTAGDIASAFVTVEVAGRNNAPTFVTDTGHTVREGQTFVVDVDVTDDSDIEDGGITYFRYVSFAGDYVDGSLFSIDPQTGELRFLQPPDHGAPLDDDGDNVYRVRIRATDSGRLATDFSMEITVTAD